MLEVIAAIRTNNSHKIPNYNPELKLHMKKLLRGLEKSPRTGESSICTNISLFTRTCRQIVYTCSSLFVCVSNDVITAKLIHDLVYSMIMYLLRLRRLLSNLIMTVSLT